MCAGPGVRVRIRVLPYSTGSTCAVCYMLHRRRIVIRENRAALLSSSLVVLSPCIYGRSGQTKAVSKTMVVPIYPCVKGIKSGSSLPVG